MGQVQYQDVFPLDDTTCGFLNPLQVLHSSLVGVSVEFPYIFVGLACQQKGIFARYFGESGSMAYFRGLNHEAGIEVRKRS